MKKRFQNDVPAVGLSDTNQERAVLLYLIGPAGKEILNTLCDTGDKCGSAMASLYSYFIPKKNFIYNCYNFQRASQNSARNIDAYVTRLQLLTKSSGYDSFEEEQIRNYAVMS